MIGMTKKKNKQSSQDHGTAYMISYNSVKSNCKSHNYRADEQSQNMDARGPINLLSLVRAHSDTEHSHSSQMFPHDIEQVEKGN